MFDDARLDDREALESVDAELRVLASAGARVRAESQTAAEQLAALAAPSRPRAVVAAGRDARLLRAVLEPVCPVPFVAWPGPGLPGWVGALDTVVILAQDSGDISASNAVAEARRRGSNLVISCGRDDSLIEQAEGPYTTILTTQSDDTFASAVLLLQALAAFELGPETDGEEIAAALDQVALDCSPFVDLAQNPAKELATAMGDTVPLLWGGSVLAARAARRVAEAVRRSSGRPALAADADQIRLVLSRTPERDVFADPFESPGADQPTTPMLLVIDDGADDPAVGVQHHELAGIADQRGIPSERISHGHGSEVARYAALVATGHYAAAYLGVGLERPRDL